MIQRASFVSVLLFLSGCATQMALNVKMIAFDPNATTGKAIGLIKGENCGVRVFGYGADAKLDEAFLDFHTKTGARYANNVSARYENKNYFAFTKSCYYVKGNAYK